MTHTHWTSYQLIEIFKFFKFCNSNHNMPSERKETDNLHLSLKSIMKQEPGMLCWKSIIPFSAALKNFLNRIIVSLIYYTSNCISTMLWIAVPWAVQMFLGFFWFFLISVVSYIISCNFYGLDCSADSKQHQALRFCTGPTEGPKRRLSIINSCSEIHTAVH